MTSIINDKKNIELDSTHSINHLKQTDSDHKKWELPQILPYQAIDSVLRTLKDISFEMEKIMEFEINEEKRKELVDLLKINHQLLAGVIK